MSRRELAKWIGLSRRDSAPNLTGRLGGRLDTWSELADDLVEIRRRASAPAPASTPSGGTPIDVSRRSGRTKTKNRARHREGP